MSEKRFEVILNEFDEVEYIMDKKMMEDRDFAEFMDFVELLARNKDEIVKENEKLRKKLECCEYEHFKKELDKIHEKVEKGDLSDFGTLTISDKGLEHWNGVLK